MQNRITLSGRQTAMRFVSPAFCYLQIARARLAIDLVEISPPPLPGMQHIVER
mgnify:CR=1 FL=1